VLIVGGQEGSLDQARSDAYNPSQRQFYKRLYDNITWWITSPCRLIFTRSRARHGVDDNA